MPTTTGRRRSPKLPDDLEQHVYARLVTVCHLWPGITPFNVFGLRLDVWLMFAAAADDYNKQMKEASRV